MKLYIMRHGEAAQASESEEQVLTLKGYAGIERLADQLKAQQLHLEKVFHSGKKRAQQTAEIMVRTLCPDVKSDRLENIKPGDNPASLLSTINNWNEDTLVTSHLPFIPNLVTLLTGTEAHLNYINYEPGTFISFEKSDSDTWNILWHISP